jgi:hypothetical protein
MLAAVENHQSAAPVALVMVCSSAIDVNELKHKQIPRRNRYDLAALRFGLSLPRSG